MFLDGIGVECVCCKQRDKTDQGTHSEGSVFIIPQTQPVIIKPVLFIPQTRPLRVVDRIGDVEKVFEELAGDVLVSHVDSGKV